MFLCACAHGVKSEILLDTGLWYSFLNLLYCSVTLCHKSDERSTAISSINRHQNTRTN